MYTIHRIEIVNYHSLGNWNYWTNVLTYMAYFNIVWLTRTFKERYRLSLWGLILPSYKENNTNSIIIGPKTILILKASFDFLANLCNSKILFTFKNTVLKLLPKKAIKNKPQSPLTWCRSIYSFKQNRISQSRLGMLKNLSYGTNRLNFLLHSVAT